MTSSVARGMASMTTHVTVFCFLFEIDVLDVVVVDTKGTRQLLQWKGTTQW